MPVRIWKNVVKATWKLYSKYTQWEKPLRRRDETKHKAWNRFAEKHTKEDKRWRLGRNKKYVEKNEKRWDSFTVPFLVLKFTTSTWYYNPLTIVHEYLSMASYRHLTRVYKYKHLPIYAVFREAVNLTTTTTPAGRMMMWQRNAPLWAI